MSSEAAIARPANELQPSRRERMRSRAKKSVARTALVATMVGLPILGGAAAVKYGPPKQIEVAGAHMAVSSEIGKNYSSLSLTSDSPSSLLVQDHTTELGKPIGASASINQHDITYGFLEQVADDPAPLADRIQEAAQAHFVERATEGAGGILLLELAGFALVLYGGKEERERRQKLIHLTVASMAAAGAVTSATGINALTDSDHQTVVGSSFLDNTPLKGTEVDVTTQTINYLVQQVPHGEDAEFYPNVEKQVIRLIETSPELNEAGWSSVVLIDDLQGNTGIARVAGTAAKTLEAPLITTGDLTTLATKKEEEYVIDALTHYAEPDDTRPIYLIAGLHDIQSVIDYAKERGLIMPDGEAVTINGITFMGFDDPRISNISQLKSGDSLRNPDESVEQFITRTRESTCAEQPDFIVTHDHKLAEQLTQTGCTSLVVGARTFDDTSETSYATSADSTQSATLTLGSGGGYDSTKIFSKDLGRPAQFVVLQTNPTTGAKRSLTFTINKDAHTELGAPFELVSATTTLEAQPAMKNNKETKAEGVEDK